jgi:hypothetical protein
VLVSEIQAVFADLGLQGRRGDHEEGFDLSECEQVSLRGLLGAMAYQSQLDRMNEKPEFN